MKDRLKIQNKERIKEYYVEDLLCFALTFMSKISENRLISMKIKTPPIRNMGKRIPARTEQ